MGSDSAFGEPFYTSEKPILDACCGSRMFWYDKSNPNVVFCDNREESHVLCDGRTLEIRPDIVADFTALPFSDNTFHLVVFDPPHLAVAGVNGWQRKKYGVLPEDWQSLIRDGFMECMRVLKPYGTLVFKWNDEHIHVQRVLDVLSVEPLFGDRRGKTRWLVFMKLK